MVRVPLSQGDRERGRQLGLALRRARGARSMAEIATRSGISTEALRKIETGRVPTPAFFTVAAIAEALGISLDTLQAQTAPEQPSEPRTA